MLTRRKFLSALAASAVGLQAATVQAAPSSAATELILCGGEEVFIIQLAPDNAVARASARAGSPDPAQRHVWSWRAADSPEIPESMRRAFRSTDDCKPIEGGRKILISSSQGAVALIERSSKRALFHAPVINAHSIEWLPGGRIAAASSINADPKANRVILFDVATQKELASDRLPAAHGLVWDAPRELLWALGGSQLRAYHVAQASSLQSDGRQDASATLLKPKFSLPLPEDNGHDLIALPGGRDLFISTGKHCWVFNRETRRLAPHEFLGNTAKIKSYSVHPKTGRVAWVQAEGTNWWTDKVHFQNPKGLLTLKGESNRLYKARWNG